MYMVNYVGYYLLGVGFFRVDSLISEYEDNLDVEIDELLFCIFNVFNV